MEPSTLTQLLRDASAGRPEALHAAWPQVYNELRTIARHRLQRFRPGDTLTTTALVHEAYLKFVNQDAVDWKDRAHFFGVASQAMRQILVDYARKQGRQKRGGGKKPITLNEELLPIQDRTDLLLTLDEALTVLAKADPRKGRLVEYKYFGGLTIKEIAVVENVSERTIKRDWRLARAMLYQTMKEMGYG